jgi:hypothetical protein
MSPFNTGIANSLSPTARSLPLALGYNQSYGEVDPKP